MPMEPVGLPSLNAVEDRTPAVSTLVSSPRLAEWPGADTTKLLSWINEWSQ